MNNISLQKKPFSCYSKLAHTEMSVGCWGYDFMKQKDWRESMGLDQANADAFRS